MGHPVRPALLIAAALAASVAPATARAGQLRIASDDLRCPNRDRIEAQIQRAIAGAMELQPDLVLALESRPPAQLVVRLQSARTVSERVVDLPPSGCAEVGRAAVLLIRGWLDRRWSEPPPPPEALEPQSEPAVVAAPPPPPPWSPRLHLGAAAGAFVEPMNHALDLRLTVGAELDLSRDWGLGLWGTRDAPMHRDIAGGSVSATPWQLALMGRLGLLSAERSGLDVLAGPTLVILRERSEGVEVSATRQFIDVGLAGALRWRRNLAANLGVFAIFEVDLRLHRETLRVTGEGDVMTLSPLTAALCLGADWAY